jgi:MoaA/NifB/PqqE/SkfB family radical SAM enzyme
MKRLTLLTNPDLCNLNCPLCFLNQRGFSRCVLGVGEMSFETARAAIEKYATERDASGKRVLREVIPSTMGEPLLYSHFDELLELCESLEISLNLTTNGTFPGKWGSDVGMAMLLRACSDIKISYLASEQFNGWKANVEKLLVVRRKLMACDAVQGGCAENAARPATVSLQVTLHKRNVDDVAKLVSWASSVGIDRIKWNPVVFLSVASQKLREMYALDDAQLESLRKELRNGALSASNVKHEGSLFFNNTVDYCAVGGKCVSCPFADEVWVWPDGHEDHCPNPERRWSKVHT